MKATVWRAGSLLRWRLWFGVGVATVLGAVALGGVVWAGPSPSSYPGRPVDGDVVWGAALGGQDPVVRHEDPAGTALELHRMYFQWRQRSGYMITSAGDDIASGRLPWVSIKTPSWADMASGVYDDEIDEMLRALDGLPGTVWLTIHHEPEGGGGVNASDDPAGPSGHVGMNRRVRERMTALGVDNVALAPILMAWTWDPASGRNPDDWWVPGIYDFVGVDHYIDNETSLLTPLWYDIREWAQDKGVDVAVGEWGMRGTDEAAGRRVHEWRDAAANSHNDGKGARVVALSAFDSPNVFSTGVWLLEGKQLTAFHDILTAEATFVPLMSSLVGFTDIENSVFVADIEWIAAEGITKGCNRPANDKYCPGDEVSRGQMAAFLVRALGLTERLDDPFTDDDGSIFEADIEKLAAAGITRGCNPPANDKFCPTDSVTRAQMAAFVGRALAYTDDGGGNHFTDTAGSLFETDIDRLATAGVTNGCNPPANDRFCPDAMVTREQMSAFLHRAFGS